MARASAEPTGNLTGLKPSATKALERLFRRRVPPDEVVTSELAYQMAEISREIERQVAVIIDRRGEITHVVVGTPSQIMLPDLGRARAGKGRLRGLRLVHTHLRNEPLTRDALVDLVLLKLDLVVAIGVTPGGVPADVYAAHIMPRAASQTDGAATSTSALATTAALGEAADDGSPWRILPKSTSAGFAWTSWSWFQPSRLSSIGCARPHANSKPKTGPSLSSSPNVAAGPNPSRCSKAYRGIGRKNGSH